MTFSDLKDAIAKLLIKNFPNVNVYSSMREEQVKRPAFYSYMKPVTSEAANQYSRHNVMSLYIDYLQEYKDEKDLYDTLQKIRDVFGNNIIVGKESVNVMDFDWDLTAADRNVAEVDITLEWFDNTRKEETAELIKDITLKAKIEEV